MKKKSKIQPQHSASRTDYFVLSIVVGYLLVDFIGNFGRGDTAPIQFLYLNIFNLIVAGCIAYFPRLRSGFDASILKRQYFVIAYGVFILLSGLTVFTAVNQTLALVSFSGVGGVRYVSQSDNRSLRSTSFNLPDLLVDRSCCAVASGICAHEN